MILAMIFLGGCANYGELSPEQRAYLAASVGQSLQQYGNQMQDTARMQSYLAQQALIQQQYRSVIVPQVPQYHSYHVGPAIGGYDISGY
jgi:hypothetical protein